MNGPFLSLLPCKLQNPNILYTWNLGGLLRVFYLIVSLVLISSLKKVLNSILKKKTWNNRNTKPFWKLLKKNSQETELSLEFTQKVQEKFSELEGVK